MLGIEGIIPSRMYFYENCKDSIFHCFFRFLSMWRVFCPLRLKFVKKIYFSV